MAKSDGFACELLDAAQTRERSAYVRAHGLRGALWSPHELEVNPLQVMHRLSDWLSEQRQVGFETNRA